jgi:hypothetical protein
METVRIRDGKKSDPGSGKHPGSATLFFYCQPCLEGVVVPEVFEEADGLDGLAEAHLVGQDEAVVLAPGVQQEVYPVNLKGKTVLKTRCRDLATGNAFVIPKNNQCYGSGSGDPMSF